MSAVTKKCMRSLAVFTEHLYGGGVEKVLQTLLRNIDTDQYDLTLFTTRNEYLSKELFSTVNKTRYLFDSLEPGDKLIKVFLKKLRNKIRLFIYYRFPPSFFYALFVKRKYDVGVAFIEGYATRVLSGGPRGMRKIAWVHTDLAENHWTRVAFRDDGQELSCYQRYDAVVCVSKKVEEIMRTKFGLAGKTQVVYNPIDRAKVLEGAKCVLPNEYKKGARLRLISIGSLIPVKGFERLLRCMSILWEEEFDFELFIIGKGIQEALLKEIVQSIGLGDRIFFTGYMDNPYPLLSTADVYICSSLAEGLNTAVTEALILGIPVVSTNCSGVRELLGDSEFGLIVENSEEGILYGLRKVLSDPDYRRDMGLAAVKRGECFSIDRPMADIYSLIR